jgi:non-heme chloroperoxidase
MPFLGVATPTSLATKAELYYEDRTLAQARTILFLHDWPLNRQEWAYPVALFSRGYRTITVDLPGFGRSDQPGGLMSYESLARDVGALITVLSLNQLIVVGAGLGAAVAAVVARRYARQVAGLVLVGALAPTYVRSDACPAGVRREAIEQLLEGSETSWPDLLTSYVRRLFHSKVGEATRQWFVQMGLEASLYAVQQTLMAIRDGDLCDEVAQLRLPTVVFQGVHDAIVPLALGEALAQQIPEAQLVRFERSGHAVWIDEPRHFSTALTGFIEERVFGNTLPPPGSEKLPDGTERLPYQAIATRPRRLPPKLEGPAGEIYE